jgi:hypothetical protein
MNASEYDDYYAAVVGMYNMGRNIVAKLPSPTRQCVMAWLREREQAAGVTARVDWREEAYREIMADYDDALDGEDSEACV